MKKVGIICEYNPLHNGHLYQMRKIREQFGEDCAIVCAMSGSFVQRGAPAIFDKSVRAKAAVLCGSDLVLELPVETALSSAEGFASGGVAVLSKCCDVLSFGVESMNADSLKTAAKTLLSEDFSAALKEELASGCSFPAARQRGLIRMGVDCDLSKPNDILAVEYCKAIRAWNTPLEIAPIIRNGSYHAQMLDHNFPSATAVRKAIAEGTEWTGAVPDAVRDLFRQAPVHTLAAGERAILGKLRTMPDEAFAALPYGSEGLWRKLMKSVRSRNTLEEIAEATKSKRYTRTRIDRMIICAFLGITEADMKECASPIRVLAFTDRGRAILHEHPEFQNAGENVTPFEQRLGDLYGLFCRDGVGQPGLESKRRVYYHQEGRG